MAPDPPPMGHRLPLLGCILVLHLLIASAQLEPTLSPGEAPSDNVQKPASPAVPPSSLLSPAAPPGFNGTSDSTPALTPAASPVNMAPTPAASSPATLSPGGSADTPSPTAPITSNPAASPLSQAAPAPAFETTHSPPAPPPSPLLIGPPPTPLWRSSLPANSSSGPTSSTKEGLSAAKKAGIGVGVLLTLALAGLVAFIIKRRRDNIQRSQYGRSQFRGYRGDTL